MNEKKRYPFLDGLRCAAILWVILHHIYTEFVYTPLNSPLTKTFLFKFGWSGYFGVDLFFVISGFLITGLLLPNNNNKINIIRFYKRRCFKILPSYFFLILSVLCFYLYVSKSNAVLLENFLRPLPNFFIFLQNILPSESLILGHLWSIAVEEHFYLTYPLLIYLIYLGNSQIAPKLRLLIFIIILIGICNIIRLTMFPFLKIHPLQNTVFRADALAFGCMIRILEDKIIQLPNPKQLTALFCLVGSMVLWFFLIDEMHDHWYSYTFAYIASGLLIISCLLGLNFLIKLLEIETFQWIGKISYNLYLWHYPLIFILFFIFKKTPVFILPCYLLMIFFMGWLTTNTIEKYFLKLRNSVVP